MFGLSLKPEIIFGLIKAIPPEKIQETRRDIMATIVQAELAAGSELMLVFTADHKNFAINADIYRRNGEHLLRTVIYDINSIFAAMEQIKNFDFSQTNQKKLNGKPEFTDTVTATGEPATEPAGTATDQPAAEPAAAGQLPA